MKELIEKYLQELLTKDAKTDITRLRGYITQSAEFFSRNGVEVPAEKDYESLREYFTSQPNNNGGTLGEGAVKKRVREARKFYAWKAENHLADMAACETPAPEKKRGRPKKVYADGEEAKKKYSMYFPESLYEAMNDLAHFNRSSVTDIMIELSREYVERNAKKLEIFRKALAQAQALEL